jgi:phage shock protein PspC (stress-responsive transcriptional regulator)
MNKTINANIAGFVFYIVEDAFEMLQTYLSAIERNFSDAAERKEIMRDIESRIAELFQAQNSSSKEVITITDVEKVIATMGKPEDYISEDYESESEHTETQEEEYEADKSEKQLFRDTDNALAGGVCSGLAAYFGIDVVLMRAIFILLAVAGLAGLFIYIILLFVIPEAKNANDKLKMKGKAINVDSIRKTAKEVKTNLENLTSRKKYGSKISQTVDKGIKVSNQLAQPLAKMLGFGSILLGIFILIILVSVFIGDAGLIPFWGQRQSITLSQAMDLIYNSYFQSSISYMAALVVLFLPILALIYSGVKLLFQIKSPLKYFAMTSTLIWCLSAGILVLTSIQLAVEFKDEAEIADQLNTQSSVQTLKIQVSQDPIFSNEMNRNDHRNMLQFVDIQSTKTYLGYPVLKIVESNIDSTFKIEVLKSSYGFNQREAILKTEAIEYGYDLANNTLTLDPYLSILNSEKFRGQFVQILVRVPKGKSVELGDNIERILQPISPTNIEFRNRAKYSSTTWTNKGNKMVYVD